MSEPKKRKRAQRSGGDAEMAVPLELWNWTGADGADGANGAPGEVTFAALLLERINHASNPLSVPVLGLVVSDPPTQPELQALAGKVDALITALRREV